VRIGASREVASRKQKWFRAHLVVRIAVEGDRRSVVHVNELLLTALDSRRAFDRALQLGKEHEDTYLNLTGRRVQVSFIGVRELCEIHETIGDGAEIGYAEYVGLSAKAIRRLVRKHSELSVLRHESAMEGPDYVSAEILEEAMMRVNAERITRKGKTAAAHGRGRVRRRKTP
jgi:hypothetical protein